MSKLWKPGKATVELPAEPRPSRIRREPVRAQTVVKAPPSREREIWTAVAGVAVIAACCAALVVGISQVTSSSGAAAAETARPVEKFGHCHKARASDCIVDGDTIVIGGRTIEIAGMDAPEIRGAACRDEARRGILAAVRLHDLLNNGAVTVGGTVRDAEGRMLRRVAVNGREVSLTLVAGGYARELAGGRRSFC